MVMKTGGYACKKTAIEEGLSGIVPGQPPTYIAMFAVFRFQEEFQNAFGPHAKEIQADVPNYTNTKSILQISRLDFDKIQAPAMQDPLPGDSFTRRQRVD
jgi:uncharacterized protein (TIGR02118 family)